MSQGFAKNQLSTQIPDGDYGDITVSGSGATFTIDNDAVTFAKIQNITDARLLGRSAGSDGDMQHITVSTGLSLAAGVLTATGTSFTAATQAEQEAGSSTTVGTTPGRQQYHPSACKGWINFNGTGTIATRNSHNLTSITDNGAGDYTVTWNVDNSAADYVAGMSYAYDATGTANRGTSGEIRDIAAGSVRCITYGTTTGTLQDVALVTCWLFGDQ